MASNVKLSDADLKLKLSHYGITSPITNTTRNVLLRKLHKLEMESSNKPNNPSIKNTSNNIESMDTTANDMNEYEIRHGMSKLGYSSIALTDSTRPFISNLIRKID